MTPPTLRQRIRSAVRMYGRENGPRAAALAAIEEAIAEFGGDAVHMAVMAAGPLFTAYQGAGMSRPEAEDVLRDLIARIDHDGFAADAGRVQDALETLLEPVVPPLMGAGEAADALDMVNTNLKKLRPPLVPVERFASGPVYLASHVMAAKARRERRP